MKNNIVAENVVYEFYEPITGQYFESSMADFVRHIHNFKQLRRDNPMANISLNDWLDELGLLRIEVGESLRWPAWEDTKDLDIYTEPTICETRKPIYVIEHEISPRYELRHYNNAYYLIHGEES